ncbi:hypothetical protein GCM10008904_32180 [Paraclostridium ghonii]|uniref:HTH LytTR-type domain-containing protein n=1 Tax=Paraclostridium ghonii TaxID=29358 RepID=A0ABU0MWU5_9FIRM|nr:hypothetical protein [Paeniclostridium ghonii]MDQ0555378.1 hypothetical protein [Paeniclostridium ghonii]
MKICIPIKDEMNFQVCSDINNAPNIIIFDTSTNDFYVKNISEMNLGRTIDYLIDNKINRLISNVSVIHHHKYISCKDIIIYKPNNNVDAFSNIKLFVANRLTIDQKKH